MLQAFKPTTLLKRDSNTVVLLWNLRSFLGNLFSRTSAVAASVNWLCQYLSFLSNCSIYFSWWASVGYPTLLISWFINFNHSLPKRIVLIHGLFSYNFWNMSTIVGWSFTNGTDVFRGYPGWRWHWQIFGIFRLQCADRDSSCNNFTSCIQKTANAAATNMEKT